MSDRMITLRVSEDELLAAKDALNDYDPRACPILDHPHAGPCDGWSPIELAAFNAARIAVSDAAFNADLR